MRVFMAACTLTLALVACQPVPIPNTYDGFRSGAITAPVQVEAYVDLLCPDCAGDWPTVKQMLAHYGPSKVSLVAHFFPLPYHTWAFKAAMTARVIYNLNSTDAAVYAWADLMYGGGQNAFENAALAGNTTTEVEQLYASTAATLGYSATDIYNGLQDGDMDEAARVGWKYSASRYTTGTPHYMINGLPIDDQLGNGQLTDWEALIDPLLPTHYGKGASAASVLLGRTRKAKSKRSVC